MIRLWFIAAFVICYNSISSSITVKRTGYDILETSLISETRDLSTSVKTLNFDASLDATKHFESVSYSVNVFQLPLNTDYIRVRFNETCQFPLLVVRSYEYPRFELSNSQMMTITGDSFGMTAINSLKISEAINLDNLETGHNSYSNQLESQIVFITPSSTKNNFKAGILCAFLESETSKTFSYDVEVSLIADKKILYWDLVETDKSTSKYSDLLDLQPGVRYAVVIRGLLIDTIIDLSFSIANSVSVTYIFAVDNKIVERILRSGSTQIKVSSIHALQVELVSQYSDPVRVTFTIESHNPKRILGMSTLVFIVICIIIVFVVFALIMLLTRFINNRKRRIHATSRSDVNIGSTQNNGVQSDELFDDRNEELIRALQNQSYINIDLSRAPPPQSIHHPVINNLQIMMGNSTEIPIYSVHMSKHEDKQLSEVDEESNVSVVSEITGHKSAKSA